MKASGMFWFSIVMSGLLITATGCVKSNEGRRAQYQRKGATEYNNIAKAGKQLSIYTQESITPKLY